MSTVRYLLGAIALYALLAVPMTYPQALHLTDTVHDDGDPLLNAWALAWVAHQLPLAPAHLFDGNAFYPERRALAFSETMLLPAVAVAPLRWLGAGVLFTYNIVFLSGFVISGAGVALLVRSLTGSGGAGLVAGIVFAFLPYRIDHFPHVQLQQTQCLPFAFWAFHRLLRTNRLRDGVIFGAFTAGQVLSCMYYGLFLAPFMALVCGALLLAERMSKQRILALVAAGAIATVAIAPVGIVYLGAHKVVGERSAEEVGRGSAMPRNYFGPPEANLMYGTLLKPFADGERRLFLGFVAIALGIVALWPAGARGFDQNVPNSGARGFDQNSPNAGARRLQPSAVLKDPRWAYALGLLFAFDLSLGFNGLSYRLLYDYVLPYRGLRVPARMGIITGFSLAVLVGYGAARLAAGRRWVFAMAGALILAEYASKPLDLRQIPTEAPESYADMLRDRGEGPTTAVFEFPASAFDDPTYMYYSTFHWQHLVNGYSGFFPPSYLRVLNAMQRFPDQSAFNAIKSHGAHYLLVHGERLYGARYEQLIPELEKRGDLKLISRRPAVGPNGHQEISLYRISYADTR
jgi:hypothetical protein